MPIRDDQITQGLEGRRILVVEDEMMIAMLVEDMLDELGCQIVGPANAVDTALALADEDGLDAAILDVNLNGQPVFSIADRLKARGVPFIFSTGYGEAGLREADRGVPVLQKPFRAGDLARKLGTLLNCGG